MYVISIRNAGSRGQFHATGRRWPPSGRLAIDRCGHSAPADTSSVWLAAVTSIDAATTPPSPTPLLSPKPETLRLIAHLRDNGVHKISPDCEPALKEQAFPDTHTQLYSPFETGSIVLQTINESKSLNNKQYKTLLGAISTMTTYYVFTSRKF